MCACMASEGLRQVWDERFVNVDLWLYFVVADRGGGGGGGRRPPPTNSVRSLPTPSAPIDLTADSPVFDDGVLKANVSWAFAHGTVYVTLTYTVYQKKTDL